MRQFGAIGIWFQLTALYFVFFPGKHRDYFSIVLVLNNLRAQQITRNWHASDVVWLVLHAHQFRLQSTIERESQQQGGRVARHSTSTINSKEKWIWIYVHSLACARLNDPICMQFTIQPMKWCCPPSGWPFPPELAQLKIIEHRHSHGPIQPGQFHTETLLSLILGCVKITKLPFIVTSWKGCQLL